MNWVDTIQCRSERNCVKCRGSSRYRRGIVATKQAQEIDFACPLGKPLVADENDSTGLGARIERTIARLPFVKNLPCYGADGKLRPESGCGKRKANLDRLFP